MSHGRDKQYAAVFKGNLAIAETMAGGEIWNGNAKLMRALTPDYV
jgi:hypothetical protein